MPAAAPSRQPGAPIRFSGPQVQWLLAQERRWLATRLATRPARPWLWLQPEASPPADGPIRHARGLRLHDCGHGYAGSLRCALPLPLANECLGDIVLQHPQPARADALLEECARVLVEGGRLWLFLLNPWSPYRLRVAGQLPAAAAGRWLPRLRAQGLQVDPPRYLGPRWTMAQGDGHVHDSPLPLRAACVVVAEKRGLAPVVPAPRAWRRGAAPAA